VTIGALGLNSLQTKLIYNVVHLYDSGYTVSTSVSSLPEILILPDHPCPIVYLPLQADASSDFLEGSVSTSVSSLPEILILPDHPCPIGYLPGQGDASAVFLEGSSGSRGALLLGICSRPGLVLAVWS
jgi:hypothetical protein